MKNHMYRLRAYPGSYAGRDISKSRLGLCHEMSIDGFLKKENYQKRSIRKLKFLGCPMCGTMEEEYQFQGYYFVNPNNKKVCVVCERSVRVADYWTKPFVLRWKKL